MNYLYLLPFQDRKHFKIGISSNNFDRINHLNNLYQLDKEKCLMITSDKTTNIKILEKELLNIFENDECDEFSTDGHTEIRNVKYLNECVDLIKSKHINLKYQIKNISDEHFKSKKVVPKVLNENNNFFDYNNLMVEILMILRSGESHIIRKIDNYYNIEIKCKPDILYSNMIEFTNWLCYIGNHYIGNSGIISIISKKDDITNNNMIKNCSLSIFEDYSIFDYISINNKKYSIPNGFIENMKKLANICEKFKKNE